MTNDRGAKTGDLLFHFLGATKRRENMKLAIRQPDPNTIVPSLRSESKSRAVNKTEDKP